MRPQELTWRAAGGRRGGAEHRTHAGCCGEGTEGLLVRGFDSQTKVTGFDAPISTA